MVMLEIMLVNRNQVVASFCKETLITQRAESSIVVVEFGLKEIAESKKQCCCGGIRLDYFFFLSYFFFSILFFFKFSHILIFSPFIFNTCKKFILSIWDLTLLTKK